MKLKEDVNVQALHKLGFTRILTEEERKACGVFQDRELLFYQPKYTLMYYLGTARRGQVYYILFSEMTRHFSILATEPEGSGCEIKLDNIFLELAKLCENSS